MDLRCDAPGAVTRLAVRGSPKTSRARSTEAIVSISGSPQEEGDRMRAEQEAKISQTEASDEEE